jgi:mannose-1-phosphate guanylyltransferase / mannose-6-phosphate isomerase
MGDLTPSQKKQLATYKSRLARVKRGEVWASDHPGPYTSEEKAAEIARLKARIVVKPGSKLSLQKHFHRSEHWVLVQGTAEVTVQNEVRSVHENKSMYIPIGSVHRLANPGKIPLELIEVQVGSYLGEDDIVRLDDVYGRS